MKLIYCPDCGDIIKLELYGTKWCKCNHSWGKYTHHINAIYGGAAIPLGINNYSFQAALIGKDKTKGKGSELTAFAIPNECDTFKYVSETPPETK